MNERKMTNEQLEEYWDNKHPKKPIIYGGRAIPQRDGRIPIDVRKMFWSEDYILADIVKNDKLICKTNDETALLCQKYIVKNYKYENDENSVGYVEYWMFPNEAVYLKTCDCEDGSLLMASLMASANIPLWRIRCNAGWVLDRNGQQQGHAYTTYCRESDNNWCVIDWCFLEDSEIDIKDKILAKNNNKYSEIWFSFNSKFSWSYKQYDIFEDLNDEPKTLFL